MILNRPNLPTSMSFGQVRLNPPFPFGQVPYGDGSTRTGMAPGSTPGNVPGFTGGQLPIARGGMPYTQTGIPPSANAGMPNLGAIGNPSQWIYQNYLQNLFGLPSFYPRLPERRNPFTFGAAPPFQPPSLPPQGGVSPPFGGSDN